MDQIVEFIESYVKHGSGDYEWSDNHGELVRCKDCWKRKFDNCPFYEYSMVVQEDDFFCADGERRQQDD